MNDDADDDIRYDIDDYDVDDVDDVACTPCRRDR